MEFHSFNSDSIPLREKQVQPALDLLFFSYPQPPGNVERLSYRRVMNTTTNFRRKTENHIALPAVRPETPNMLHHNYITNCPGQLVGFESPCERKPLPYTAVTEDRPIPRNGKKDLRMPIRGT